MMWNSCAELRFLIAVDTRVPDYSVNGDRLYRRRKRACKVRVRTTHGGGGDVMFGSTGVR